MRKYFMRFLKDEEGAELIQFAIVVGIAAGLAVVVKFVFDAAGEKLEEAADAVSGIEIAGLD